MIFVYILENYYYYTILTPYISKPSSVNVPVLSKHIIVILPLILTFYGDIQYIFFYYNLLNAILIPIYKHVGNAGGTVIVIRSKPSFINSHIVIEPSYKNTILLGTVIMKPRTANIAIIPTNFIESA